MEEKKGGPWERQEGESEKAYEAFKIFCEMGDERGATAVAKKLSKSRQLINRWKYTYSWENRALAYDVELQRQYLEKRKKTIQSSKDDWVKISYSLIKKALEAWNLMDPSEMSPKDIKEILRLALEIQEKILFIEPTTTTEVQKQTSLADLIVSAYDENHGDNSNVI